MFDKRWKYVQDTDMWFRLFQKYHVCYVPELLAKRRVHSNQTGVLAETAFQNDLWNLRSYYAMQLSCADYYPTLNETYTHPLKKILIQIWCKLYYKKYIPFCHTYHLPITLKQYVWRLAIPNALKRRILKLYGLFQRKNVMYLFNIRRELK